MVAVICAGALIAASPAAASSEAGWRPVPHDSAAAMWASGSYLYSETSQPWLGELLDVRAGTPVNIRAPRGCQPVTIGGPWMLFSCGTGPPVELYQLAPPHSWRQPADEAALLDACAQMQASCQPVDVGSDWIDYDAEICPLDEHCAYTPEFQNIATGTVQADPATPGGTMYADLDSVTLSQRLCRPLRTPVSAQDFGPPEPGELAFYGAFALASTADQLGGSQTESLERCGSSKAQRLVTSYYSPPSFAADSDAVVWLRGSGRIDGIALPEDRRFTIAIPPRARPTPMYPVNNLAISGRRLFVIRLGTIWTTTLPAVSRAG